MSEEKTMREVLYENVEKYGIEVLGVLDTPALKEQMREIVDEVLARRGDHADVQPGNLDDACQCVVKAILSDDLPMDMAPFGPAFCEYFAEKERTCADFAKDDASHQAAAEEFMRKRRAQYIELHKDDPMPPHPMAFHVDEVQAGCTPKLVELGDGIAVSEHQIDAAVKAGCSGNVPTINHEYAEQNAFAVPNVDVDTIKVGVQPEGYYIMPDEAYVDVSFASTWYVHIDLLPDELRQVVRLYLNVRRGTVLHANKRFKKAVAELNEVVQKLPDDADAPCVVKCA